MALILILARVWNSICLTLSIYSKYAQFETLLLKYFCFIEIALMITFNYKKKNVIYQEERINLNEIGTYLKVKNRL